MIGTGQKVGDSWRCDGCGKVARWGPDWAHYGSIALAEEGIFMWISCSDECRKMMPSELLELKVPTFLGWPHNSPGLDCFLARLRIVRAVRPMAAREGESCDLEDRG
jgi:hypothetical protein